MSKDKESKESKEAEVSVVLDVASVDVVGEASVVVDVSSLPRPAAGLSSVPLPSVGMAKPEKLLKLKGVARESEESEESEEGEAASKPVTYAPRASSAKLVDHQKHAIAQAIVSGLPVNEIAGMVRHTPAYIKRCIAEDEEIKSYAEHYSSMLMRARVEYQFAMLERSEKAWRVLDDALVDKDIRVRMMAMDKVFAAGELRATGDSPTVEFNFTDPEAHKALSEATQGIHNLLKEIQAGNLVADPITKHLHNTLPGPEDVIGHIPRRD